MRSSAASHPASEVNGVAAVARLAAATFCKNLLLDASLSFFIEVFVFILWYIVKELSERSKDHKPFKFIQPGICCHSMNSIRRQNAGSFLLSTPTTVHPRH
jgi:hypothetical protein